MKKIPDTRQLALYLEREGLLPICYLRYSRPWVATSILKKRQDNYEQK